MSIFVWKQKNNINPYAFSVVVWSDHNPEDGGGSLKYFLRNTGGP
jgi:hypothetical protein